MPRFFFHLHNDGFSPDRDGTELSSRHEAWKHAGSTCGAMLRDLGGKLAIGSEWQMEVRDETGALCWRFHFVAEGIDPTG